MPSDLTQLFITCTNTTVKYSESSWPRILRESFGRLE